MMMTVIMTVITFNGEEEDDDDVDNVDACACDEGYDGTQLS